MAVVESSPATNVAIESSAEHKKILVCILNEGDRD